MPDGDESFHTYDSCEMDKDLADFENNTWTYYPGTLIMTPSVVPKPDMQLGILPKDDDGMFGMWRKPNVIMDTLSWQLFQRCLGQPDAFGWISISENMAKIYNQHLTFSFMKKWLDDWQIKEISSKYTEGVLVLDPNYDKLHVWTDWSVTQGCGMIVATTKKPKLWMWQFLVEEGSPAAGKALGPKPEGTDVRRELGLHVHAIRKDNKIIDFNPGVNSRPERNEKVSLRVDYTVNTSGSTKSKPATNKNNCWSEFTVCTKEVAAFFCGDDARVLVDTDAAHNQPCFSVVPACHTGPEGESPFEMIKLMSGSTVPVFSREKALDADNLIKLGVFQVAQVEYWKAKKETMGTHGKNVTEVQNVWIKFEDIDSFPSQVKHTCVVGEETGKAALHALNVGRHGINLAALRQFSNPAGVADRHDVPSYSEIYTHESKIYSWVECPPNRYSQLHPSYEQTLVPCTHAMVLTCWVGASKNKPKRDKIRAKFKNIVESVKPKLSAHFQRWTRSKPGSGPKF